MKKITALCLALMIAVAGMAITFSHELIYEGFPYYRTQCSVPTYMVGTIVTLSSYVPEKDGVSLVGWRYDGQVYAPGASFTMPGTDVVLVPVWADETGIEQLKTTAPAVKMIRNGHLIIVRDGVEYNIMGGKLQ